ncbi:MAG TPA: hypothetical protein PK109_03405 [Candidatus Paceibacterota bacterium]|nr:hypothetical protein [Candidatus Paceibacterota bacterium]
MTGTAPEALSTIEKPNWFLALVYGVSVLFYAGSLVVVTTIIILSWRITFDLLLIVVGALIPITLFVALLPRGIGEIGLGILIASVICNILRKLFPKEDETNQEAYVIE